MSDDTRRQFTVAEADRTIPALERRLDRLSGLVRELVPRAPQDSDELRRVGNEGGGPVPPAYFAGIQEIAREIGRLQESGIILRDLEKGLVDFPSVLDGREVYLCWVRGEARVAWFHDPESGFAGRQPLPPGTA